MMKVVCIFFSILSIVYGFDCPNPNGIFADPADCSQFYVCANGKPFQEACGKGTLFDEAMKVCAREADVECGDRPIPGPSTTPYTGPTTTPTTPYTGPTTTRKPPPPGPLPNKVLGFYVLLADDTEEGFESDAEWEPELFEYQQTNSNLLFFTFINPTDMAIPPAFKNLAATRGSGAKGSVPKDTKISFAIGGYEYSRNPNPWPFLTSQSAAEAMAAVVAKWPAVYGCDGIDLDIEEGAGSSKTSGVNMVHFVKKLRELNPDIIITQPSYGTPSIPAEVEVINASWEKDGTSKNLAYSVGLMVYQGTIVLDYVKYFTHGTTEVSSLTCDVPTNRVLLGAGGGNLCSPADIMTLATESIKQDLMGIMVWYGSVANGFQYGGWDHFDASTCPASQDGFGEAMKLFNQHNH